MRAQGIEDDCWARGGERGGDSSPSPDATAAALISLLLSNEHAGPWTVAELQQELGSPVTVADVLRELHGAGLLHIRGDVVFASRAAQKFDGLDL